MDNKITQDATPHPRQGGIHPNDSDNDHEHQPAVTVTSASSSRTHSRQSTHASGQHRSREEAFRASVFGHSSPRHTHDSDNSHSEDDDEEEESDKDHGHGSRRRKSRRRRVSESASHLLAQAPTVPDLRFDHNYRKALDQIYEVHAAETAKAAAAAATPRLTLDEKDGYSALSPHTKTKAAPSVPSIRARIAVMTVRDIIIMPFVHGFFWGFGTVILTLVGQRSLAYHVTRTWRRYFGSSDVSPETLPAIRGEPARVRRGGSAGGFGGLGLGSGAGGYAQPGFGNSSTRVY